MRVLLLTPPMTQLNTPYPATAYLTGFLRKSGIDAVQGDPAIELVLRLFSKVGLQKIKNEILTEQNQKSQDQKNCSLKKKNSKILSHFLHHFNQYELTVEPVIRFLQGKDPSLALKIVTREFLPEGPRFKALVEGSAENDPDPVYWAFGSLGVHDRAKYLASLYLDDLADVIRDGVDSRFELSRYGEKLAASTPTFDLLQNALDSQPSIVDLTLDELTLEFIEKHKPNLVGVTAPFPGNVYGAFRIAKAIKSRFPQVTVLLGGGYVNTELRQLSEPRVFNYFDYITLDDGEMPFLCVLEHLEGKRTLDQLLRTYIRQNDKVVLKNDSTVHDIPHRNTGIPTYDGLPLDRYLSIFEMLNPVHRIWSDGRWNKLTLAHGCYWRKCNFCDVTLDYIGRYDPATADVLMDRIESMIRETGQTGFHFVDEAAPPAVLRSLAEKIIARGLSITWWGNVRFDKVFTPELTRLLAKSGCVAVTGGLEVASDRLLKLMQKGVTVQQVAKVTHAFSEAGIMVHAYLMYGFPTQTVQETVDALERVRQLFEAGCMQSAYWHRFSATAHSPIGINPDQFGIRILKEPQVTFARNDLPFEDLTKCDHDFLGEGLKKALYNYMHGVGLDMDIRVWFGQKSQSKFLVPSPKVPKNLIQQALNDK